VGPGGKSLLATIVKSDTVRVDFSMTGMDYLRSKERNVNLGQKDSTRRWNPYITVTLPDNSRYPLRGLVDFADPQVDPETGTFSVRAEMPNPDHILLPGQFTKVKLLLDVRENAVVVPSKAIVIEKGGAYIFVVRPDSVVEKRFIETGPELDNKTVVERGLLSGERIVVALPQTQSRYARRGGRAPARQWRGIQLTTAYEERFLYRPAGLFDRSLGHHRHRARHRTGAAAHRPVSPRSSRPW